MHYMWLQASNPDGSMVSQFTVPDDRDAEVQVTAMYQGEADDLPEVFRRHNSDHRPLGKITRSMSVGDIVVQWTEAENASVHVVAPFGWRELTGDLADTLVRLAFHRTKSREIIRGDQYWESLKGESMRGA